MSTIKSSQLQIYDIINQFVQNKRISLKQFWNSDRLCVPTQNFVQMLQAIGLNDQRLSLKNFEKQQIDLISIQNLIQGVHYWKIFQQNISTYLTKPSPKPIKKYQQSQQFSEYNKIRSITGSNLNYTRTNKKFLNQHAKKQMSQKMKLNNTLKNVKNQSNYELSMKVGQLNDICAKLKNGTTFYIQTNNSGKVQIFINQKGKPEQKLSEHQFQYRFQKLKLQIMNQVEESEGTLEQDLKKVLVQIMCLSSDMKKQIRLLQQKGISH